MKTITNEKQRCKFEQKKLEMMPSTRMKQTPNQWYICFLCNVLSLVSFTHLLFTFFWVDEHMEQSWWSQPFNQKQCFRKFNSQHHGSQSQKGSWFCKTCVCFIFRVLLAGTKTCSHFYCLIYQTGLRAKWHQIIDIRPCLFSSIWQLSVFGSNSDVTYAWCYLSLSEIYVFFLLRLYTNKITYLLFFWVVAVIRNQSIMFSFISGETLCKCLVSI